MSKIVIIGAGHVGSHCAYALLLQGICSELVLVDIDSSKARSHALDLADAIPYSRQVTVRGGSIADCTDADIVVISAGLPRMPGQTRTDVMRDTMKTARIIAPQLAETGFSGILISISNPADVIAQYFYSQLNLPAARVISTGTALDTARLRRIIARELNISADSVSGYVLGEHGDSQTVPWSQVRIGSESLLSLIERRAVPKLDLNALAYETKMTGTDVIDGKGATEFGIGAALARIASAVLRDEKCVLPVSTLLNGEYCQHDVFAGVPAVIGRGGMERLLPLTLTDDELAAFEASCTTIRGNFTAAQNM